MSNADIKAESETYLGCGCVREINQTSQETPSKIEGSIAEPEIDIKKNTDHHEPILKRGKCPKCRRSAKRENGSSNSGGEKHARSQLAEPQDDCKCAECKAKGREVGSNVR